MSQPALHARIGEAASVEEIIALTGEFLAMWSSADLAALPESCRPGAIKGADDLVHWQSVLVEEYCGGAAIDGRRGEVVRDLLALFTAATERAEAITAGPGAARELVSENSLPKLFR